MDDPFLLFPEEVWELILDRLADSQDAWNLLKAYPQLDSNPALQSKKRVWLFGLVIPHLVKRASRNWIKEGELLNCRLVSKTWSVAVDSFLENQPQLRAYIPETQQEPDGRFPWETRTYLEIIDRMSNPEDEEDAMLPLERTMRNMLRKPNPIIGGTKINDSQGRESRSLRRFLRDMQGRPPDRSPFLSRFLSLSIMEGPASASRLAPDFTSILLTSYGHHVMVFHLDFELPDLSPLFMANCLRRLPNLKCLKLRGRPRDLSLSHIPEVASALVPALPSLETLMIQYSRIQLGRSEERRFSAQIRKLQFEMGLWRSEYSNLFPNLAELEITDVRQECCGHLKTFLHSLQAPSLGKLMIKSKFYESWEKAFDAGEFDIESDIFELLKRFPHIRYFNFGEWCFIGRCVQKGIMTLSPGKDSVPALQFLSIRVSSNMGYNFLRCLPSLEHLQLHVTSKPIVIDHSCNPGVRIMEEIQTATIYKSNIWELLPNLKTVTLLTEEYYYFPFQICSFTREGYEYGMKNQLGFNSAGEFAKLRRDIIDFLDGEAYEESGSESDPSSSESELSLDSLSESDE